MSSLVRYGVRHEPCNPRYLVKGSMEAFDIMSRMCEIKLFREVSLVLSAIFIPAGTQDHGDRALVRLGARGL